jgi:hypothetical protein
MPIYASPETIAEVASLLCPVNGKTPREINKALPLTGRQTVYNALYLLVREGRAMAEGEMCKRRYRLVGGAT